MFCPNGGGKAPIYSEKDETIMEQRRREGTKMLVSSLIRWMENMVSKQIMSIKIMFTGLWSQVGLANGPNTIKSCQSNMVSFRQASWVERDKWSLVILRNFSYIVYRFISSSQPGFKMLYPLALARCINAKRKGKTISNLVISIGM